jgi:hypothetical protein
VSHVASIDGVQPRQLHAVAAVARIHKPILMIGVLLSGLWDAQKLAPTSEYEC